MQTIFFSTARTLTEVCGKNFVKNGLLGIRLSSEYMTANVTSALLTLVVIQFGLKPSISQSWGERWIVQFPFNIYLISLLWAELWQIWILKLETVDSLGTGTPVQFILGLLIAITSCAPDEGPARPGSRAPAPRIPDADGRSRSSSFEQSTEGRLKFARNYSDIYCVLFQFLFGESFVLTIFRQKIA